MSAIQTTLFPPPNQSRAVDEKGFFTESQQQWQFTLQRRAPLVEVDTTTGNLVQSVPAAGLDSSTGQSNQNQEITYVKVSADGNSFTLNGVASGAIVISAQYAFFKIKSDGSHWYRTG